MKIDLYHIYKQLHLASFGYPIVLDALKLWAESIGWKARVFICKESDVDLSTDADVVGISVYTVTAPAAFRLSQKLRQKGKVVVLGGPHFRGHRTYAEASLCCDVVVNSISQNRLKTLLKSIERGEIASNRKKALYIVDKQREFRYPNRFYESFQNQKWFHMSSVPTSLGCPYLCDFCSPYMQGDYFLRNVDTICDEVYRAKGRTVFLSDATFGMNKPFTVELMKRLAPAGKKLLVEMALARLNDHEMQDALALGGVKWVVVGIETLALRLRKHGSVDLNDDLRRLIDRVHERGMLIQGNIICGMDCDGPESFERIYNFVIKSQLDAIMIGILTPFPNTRIYDQLQRQGRILDRDWEHYDYRHLVYRPFRMSAGQLVNGFVDLYKSLSNPRRILNEGFRICRDRGLTIETAIFMGYNVFNWRDAIKTERGLKRNLMRTTDNYGSSSIEDGWVC